MAHPSLRIFSTLIVTLTVGILLSALLSHIPGGVSAILALVLNPAGMQYLTLGSLGLLALLEVIVLVPRASAGVEPMWHMAFFPSMPVAVGMFSSGDDAE